MEQSYTGLGHVRIAKDTFVVQHHVGGGQGPVVHMNAMVIRGSQPMIVDTGAPIHRDAMLSDIFAVVEPDDVRWIFVSHDDIDHYGNLNALMAQCRNATLVGSWFLCERLVGELEARPDRWHWLNHGDQLDVGDRRVVALRPPVYDSPTTRGLFDPTTGVYWGSDCFSAPVAEPTSFADELEPGAWEEGSRTFHQWISPWVSQVNSIAFRHDVDALSDVGITTIATGHGPTIRNSHIPAAFDMLRSLPGTQAAPQPGHDALTQMVVTAQ